ncbi:MAG TPA: hypothetical protein VFH83_01955 [Spirochaetia bacterium]|nr:hypothetical protein [Spirochaetia bacterium]
MGTSTMSPTLRRGALVIYTSDSPGTQPVTVNFQYNPGELRRTLTSRRPRDAAQPSAAPQDARLVAGPPVEAISLSVELDAADQLADPSSNQDTVDHGLHMPLAALEMLLYPPSAQFEHNQQLAQNGQIQVSPSVLSLVLLDWGESRMVPVMVTSFSVTEQEFDTQLNPIRAKVDLGLQVLTYLDLRDNSTGVDAFVSYQKEKERLARGYYTGSTPAQTQNLSPD